MAKSQDKPNGPASGTQEPEPLTAPIHDPLGSVGRPVDADLFRRQAALAILGAYVQRHGGFSTNSFESETHCRLIWQYADTFVSLEHAPPPEPEPPPEPDNKPPQRAATPSDEWAVLDGGKWHRGFVSREEAEWYSAARPGSRVKQISGQQVLVADPSVT